MTYRYDDEAEPQLDDEDVEEEMTPEDPDWDLSEEHGYTWEAERERPIPAWVLFAVTVVVVVALVLPTVLIIANYS